MAKRTRIRPHGSGHRRGARKGGIGPLGGGYRLAGQGFGMAPPEAIGNEARTPNWLSVQLRDLANAVPDIVFRMRLPDFTLDFVTPAVTTYLGYSPDELIGTPYVWQQIVHPADRDTVLAELERALEKDGGWLSDHRGRHKDGVTVRWFDAHTTVQRDAQGRPDALVGVVRDVTDRRCTETQLQRMNRALRTIGRCHQALVHIDDEAGLLDAICSHLVTEGGYSLAWVGYPEEGPDRPVRVAAKAGPDTDYLDDIRVSWGDNPSGQGPTGRAIRTGETVIAREIATEPDYQPWRDRALARGYGASIALPLIRGETVWGALNLYVVQREELDAEEIELLEGLANDLAHGIEALRRREREREAKRAWQESERKFRAIFENAIDGILLADAETLQLHSANAMAQQMLGYTHEELTALRVPDLHPDEDPRQIEANCAAMARGEQTLVSAMPTRRKDGTLLYIDITASSVQLDARTYLVGLFRDVTALREAEAEREAQSAHLQETLVATVQAVARTVELRDPYTSGHQERVADLAIAIAKELGWDEHRIEGLRLGALVHDIGKIAIPSEILTRPGPLSSSEYTIIQGHARTGYDIIKDVDFPWPVAETVLQHHERLDGSGYPQGLRGDDIIPEARILAVADVLESIASHRPYRPARGVAVALQELERGSGSQYDPEAVAACRGVIESGRYDLPG